MNKMISYAKIMFAGLAVYLAIGVVRNLLFTIAYAFQKPSLGSVGIILLSLLLSCAYLVAIIYFLVLKSDKWTRKLIANDIHPDSSPTPDVTLTMAFRLVCVGAGMYCILSFIWLVSRFATRFLQFLKFNQPNQNTEYRQIYTSSSLSVSEFLPSVLVLALAVYLLCGAPHFVRWQVKKTLKLCNEHQELKNNPSQ